ncbi:hypothetical protein BDV93DRAFT_193793 [Ceratobasidium sp. AG-I]|nr:hypothetical protein BDV93DRAFT_193793 [Ceratobasidium sp. AG-I]
MRKPGSSLSTSKLHRMMMRAAKKDIPPRIPNTPYLQRCTNALLKCIIRRKAYDELNPCVLLDDDLNNIKANEAVKKVKTDLIDRDAELAKLVRTRTLGPEDLLDISHESFLKLAPHFSPGQLLRLVLNKASGSLGELLGQPEAGEIWKLSERNIKGLPLRPPYIRGDEYAELLFRPVCSVCGRVTPQPLDVQFMERLCEACRQVPSNAMVAEDCILVHLSGLVPSSSGTLDHPIILAQA